MIASCALAIGLCSRAAQDREAVHDWQRALIAAIIGSLVAARPPYFPLLALLVLPPLRLGRPDWGGERAIRAALPLLTFATAIPLLWTLVGAAPLKVPFRAHEGVSIAGQLAHMLTHPLALFSAAYNSFERIGDLYFKQFVGVLGWLDTYFPRSYYCVSAAVLGAGLLAAASGPGRDLRPGDRWMLAAAVLCSFVMLYVVQYLSWSPVGSDWIDGVQGRYFVPLALVLALAIPSFSDSEAADRNLSLDTAGLFVGWTVLLGFCALNLFAVPWIVLTRYYG